MKFEGSRSAHMFRLVSLAAQRNASAQHEEETLESATNNFSSPAPCHLLVLSATCALSAYSWIVKPKRL